MLITFTIDRKLCSLARIIERYLRRLDNAVRAATSNASPTHQSYVCIMVVGFSYLSNISNTMSNMVQTLPMLHVFPFVLSPPFVSG